MGMLIISCDKEEIDITNEEEENPTVVVNCDLDVSIEIDSSSTGGFIYSAVVSGGTSPFVYEWGSGETTESIEVLDLESNFVMVTDSDGCTAMDTLDNQTNTGCANFTGGISVDSMGILLNAWTDGGTAPYTFAWSSGENTESIEVTVPGIYALTIIDAQGCIVEDSYDYASSDPCDNFVGGITVDTLNNNLLSAWVSGGTSPYSYEWSTGETTESIEVNEPGDYTLTIIDAQGCLVSNVYTYESTEPCNNFTGGIMLADTSSNSNLLSVWVSGGTPPYIYEWSTGEITESIEVTETGDYGLTIIDSEGCIVSDVYTVE